MFVDQNECEVGTHNCGSGYECFNIEGSFRCNPKRCPAGYQFSSRTRQCVRMECPDGMRGDGSSVCSGQCSTGSNLKYSLFATSD